MTSENEPRNPVPGHSRETRRLPATLASFEARSSGEPPGRSAESPWRRPLSRLTPRFPSNLRNFIRRRSPKNAREDKYDQNKQPTEEDEQHVLEKEKKKRCSSYAGGWKARRRWQNWRGAPGALSSPHPLGREHP